VQVPGELAAVYPNLFVILSDARRKRSDRAQVEDPMLAALHEPIPPAPPWKSGASSFALLPCAEERRFELRALPCVEGDARSNTFVTQVEERRFSAAYSTQEAGALAPVGQKKALALFHRNRFPLKRSASL
jgi:hypothetical protein